MNIVIVSQYFWPENFRINDLAVGLKEKGHNVSVVCGLPNYPSGKIFEGYGFFKRYLEDFDGIKVYRVPLLARGNGKPLRLILNYLSYALFASLLGPFYCKGRVDAIFVFEVSPVTVGLPAIVLKKIKKAPIFFWVLDLWPESVASAGGINSAWVLNGVRHLVRYIYRRCDKILVSSRRFIESIKAIDPSITDIEYFPNFIEASILLNADHESAGLWYDFPPGFNIVFAGNIGYAQSFQTIIQAADQLRDYRDIHWVILGEGRLAGWVKDRLSELKLWSNFHLPGFFPPETMPYFFRQADVLLVSLKREQNFELTVPGKIQSYMACGKPVIASLDGEGANIINEAAAGVSCPAEDSDALASAVLRVYGLSKEEREKMGGEGKEYCQKNFNRDILMEQLENWMEQKCCVDE